MMRQQLFDPSGWLRGQPLEHVAQVDVWIQSVELGRVDQAHHGRGSLSRPQAAGEQPVQPLDSDKRAAKTSCQ